METILNQCNIYRSIILTMTYFIGVKIILFKINNLNKIIL